MKKYRFFFSLAVLLCPTIIHAEAVTDGSVGVIKSLGGNFEVPASLGIISGTNLFHSFQTFNINSGESATFTGASNILNVISRVTGGGISNINGTLSSKVGNADFYFINPTGIVFGKDAKLDVPASFYASSANSLYFKDSLNYSTINLKDNTLSVSSPESFGLTTVSSTNNSFIEVDGSDFKLQDKQSIGLASNKIYAHDNAKFFAKEGKIGFYTPLSNGQIKISDVNTFRVAGNGSGYIELKGTDIQIQNSIINASNSGASDANKSISIDASKLTITQSNLLADAIDAGHAGNIDIHVEDLQLAKGSNISSNTNSFGMAGNINITSKNSITLQEESSLAVNTSDTGDAGNINIHTHDLQLSQDSIMSSNSAGKGKGGEVAVFATGTISAQDGGDFSARSYSSGAGGIVNLTSNTINFDGDASGVITDAYRGGEAGKSEVNASTIIISAGADIISNAYGTGKAGDISVHAKDIKIIEKGRIASNTYGQGNAGNVSIQANHLLVDGHNSDIYTGIASNAYELSDGNAGNVHVEAKEINLINAGRITTNTRGTGKAGDVIIQADNINIDAKNSEYLAGIASAASPESLGQTGNIDITANNQLNLSNAAQISIQSRANVPNPTSVTAGQINISTPILNITNNALINAKATENTDASNINLYIANALQMNLGSISTQANSGNGGAINIKTGDYTDLHRSSITTSVASSVGNGGNITVSSPALVLENGMVQANAYSGHGGDVFIKVDSLIGSQSQLLQGGEKPVVWSSNVSGFNVIQAASQFGLSGTVNVTSPQMNLSGILANLSTSSFARDVLSQDYCNVGVGSSLTVRGYGALPSKPSDLLY